MAPNHQIAQTAPEGYDLFSWCSVLIALANVFPLVYVLFVNRFPPRLHEEMDRWSVLLFVQLFGILFCVLLALYWKTVQHSHSTALFALTFFAGGTDCLSSVLFYPIAQRYQRVNISGLIAGETLTGLLAVLIATAQSSEWGAGGGKLSVTIYFFLMALIMALSAVGFLVLEGRLLAKSVSEGGLFHTMCLRAQPASGERAGERAGFAPPDTAKTAALERASSSQSASWLPQQRSGVLLLAGQAAFAFVENGMLPTLLPASLKPYPDADELISLATKLSFGGAILATLVAYRYPIASPIDNNGRMMWGAVLLLAYVLAFYVLVLATAEVQVQSRAFGTLAVAANVLCKWVVTYGKTCLFAAFHPDGSSDAAAATATASNDSREAASEFRFGGLGIQLGTFVGAVLFFCLNTFAHSFH
jgi:hypothetical protein